MGYVGLAHKLLELKCLLFVFCDVIIKLPSWSQDQATQPKDTLKKKRKQAANKTRKASKKKASDKMNICMKSYIVVIISVLILFGRRASENPITGGWGEVMYIVQSSKNVS